MKNIDKVKRALKKKGLSRYVNADCWRKSVILTGEVNSWEKKVEAGFAAAHKGFKGVINDIEVTGIDREKIRTSSISDSLLENRYFDVVIIGGGIIGCAVAREISRLNVSIALLEKEEDLAMQTSSRNDGMIHPGFAARPGTKKAYYNILGNDLYTQWSEDLGFELKRPGSLVLFNSPFEKLLVPLFNRRARKNGVQGKYGYLSRKEVYRREPNVTNKQHGGFFFPTAGIISPYKASIAMVENAIQNGAELFLNTYVDSFVMGKGTIHSVSTNRGTLTSSIVINCAGNFADTVAQYGDDRFFSLHGRKGTECILDSRTGELQNNILSMPKVLKMKSKTKGGGSVPCIEGNILLGPTAEEQPWKEDFSTDRKSFNFLLERMELNRKLNQSSIITYFSGIRPASWEEDFIVEPSEILDNFIHAAAIQSPGVASAPAIAIDVAKMAKDLLSAKGEVFEKKDFNPIKTARYSRITSIEQRAMAVNDNKAYGNIICRCETISEQEIRDVLQGPIPVSSLDAVKRRIRAGAGRCHGGFCTPKVMEIISDELQISMLDITKKGGKSVVLTGETK